jgi:SAM-dependent methyltransferase
MKQQAKKTLVTSKSSLTSIRNNYSNQTVEGYYNSNSHSYINPHYGIIKENLIKFIEDCNISFITTLDLCCGSGEISKILVNSVNTGCDPYLYQRYIKETNNKCYKFDFKDIANNKLIGKFDLIVCSFALHLCNKSLLPNVLYNLSCISDKLLVISPNKNPTIDKYWNLSNSIIIDRVHFKYYVKSI